MMEPSLFLRIISAPSWLPTGAVVPGLSGMIWHVLAGWVPFWCSSEGVSLLLVLLADLCAFSWDLPLDLEIVRDFISCLDRLLESCLFSDLFSRDGLLLGLLLCCLLELSLSREAGCGCSWLLLLLVLGCSGARGLFLLLSLVFEVRCAVAFLFLSSSICHFLPSFSSRGLGGW